MGSPAKREKSDMKLSMGNFIKFSVRKSDQKLYQKARPLTDDSFALVGGQKKGTEVKP